MLWECKRLPTQYFNMLLIWQTHFVNDCCVKYYGSYTYLLMPDLWKLSFAFYIWDTVFKNGPSNICGRQPLTNLK